MNIRNKLYTIAHCITAMCYKYNIGEDLIMENNKINYTLSSNENIGEHEEIAYGLYEEKKSKFYCYIFKIDNENQALCSINNIKLANTNARHIVYIYSFKNENGGISVKFSDDGEPQGTGTRAIYDMLQKEKLTNLCVVIVRYFGGILLGAGPLSRAYLKSFKSAFEICHKEIIYNYLNFKINVKYSNFNSVKNILLNYEKKHDIIDFNAKFSDEITITFKVKDSIYDEISDKLKMF